MKRQTLWPSAVLSVALATALFGAAPVHAGARHHGFTDHAKVVDVEPIVRWREVAVDRRVCRDRRPRRGHQDHRRHRHQRGRDRDSIVPTVLGGVVGGVIGNQIGDGDARVIATAAGTAVGAVIGHELGEVSHRDHRPRRRERCRTVTEYERQREVVGYRVSYRYKGREFSTRTDHHPGRRIRVKVDVRPH